MKSSLHLDLGAVAGGYDELPPLAALFLVHFDTKKGYTIEWQRAADGVDLDGVEFKSLPSGLHNLREDLVYFVHGVYAGVSAFVHVDAGVEERGALMVSAGVLVPLSYGRLGRSWRHTEGLKVLARAFAEDPTTHQKLDEYYETHKLQGPALSLTDSLLVNTLDVDPLLVSPKGGLHRHIRTRSVSEAGTMPVPGQTLSQFHPALSLGEFMDTFGPLMFPIYRAALARKRILLVGHAPVEIMCNFVYDISILSNIPLSVMDTLPVEPARLKPLFNIGVHDIPLLETEARTRAETVNPVMVEGEHGGWVACTTDALLGLKKELWDVLIRIPPPHSKQAREKVWPTAESSTGTPLKATQRDLRRYRALTRSLRARYHQLQHQQEDDDDEPEEPSNIEELCEKLSWTEIAYSSFIWWASAGEQQQRSDAEADDGRLPLDTYFAYTPTVTPAAEAAPPETETPSTQPQTLASSSSSSSSSPAPTTARRRGSYRIAGPRRRRSTMCDRGSEELDVIAYFHRMTQRVFSVLAHRMAEAEEHEEDEGEEDEERRLGEGGGEEERAMVLLEEVERMGFDRYSDADRIAIADIVARWWGRGVNVEVGRITCCGVQCG